MKEVLTKNVSTLKLEKKIINKLLERDINTILDLCNHTRMTLGDLDFANDQINAIIIALQLEGLDLKKNHAKRNTLVESLM